MVQNFGKTIQKVTRRDACIVDKQKVYNKKCMQSTKIGKIYASHDMLYQRYKY